MLKDFATEDRVLTKIKKEKYKWKTENKRYLERLGLMKEKKEENYINRRNELLKEYAEKDKNINLHLQEARKAKEAERQKSLEISLKKEAEAKEKYRQKLEKEEKKRKKLQTQIFDKINTFIDNNNNSKKKQHLLEVKKLQNEEIRHRNNLVGVQKSNDERMEKNKEKIFEKYISFYYLRKSREKEFKKKNLNCNDKFAEKAEQIEEIERKQNLKTEELIKKLANIESRKKEILKHKNDYFVTFKQKRNEYNESCYNKRLLMDKEMDAGRADILGFQTEVIKKSLNQTHLNNLKKAHSTEKTLYNQINFKKNLKTFYQKLENIKSQCVLRKPVEERRKIYINIKRAEREKKKKDEEERLLDMNLNK